ncbi:MAG TPA: hypothetical protein VM032_03580 [Vicinamibacterales bacterium]|nr:hypothetical protein [Vicinamibacterales bacterium]
MANRRNRSLPIVVRLAGAGALLVALLSSAARLEAAVQPVETQQNDGANPLVENTTLALSVPMQEIRDALVRLPLAAVLGTVLALRPRRRGQARRSILVVQTQIMLAVVGAVIMLVVGNSLSRAFGIVGAAGLVRYRSTIDDPKEAVVMLCALGAGLASGVGLYVLAPFATVFMAALLWVVEYFEPAALKFFELTIATANAGELRPKIEGVLHGLRLEYELLTETEDEVSYSVSAPLDVRTRDISDTLRLVSGTEIEIEWKERRARKR